MKKKLIIFVSCIALVAIIGWWLTWKLERQQRNRAIAEVPILKQNEKTKIITNTTKKRVTIVERQPDNTQKTTVKEGVESFVVSVDTEGKTAIWVMDSGFTWRGGIGMTYANEPRILVDDKFYFYKRYGIHFGITFGVEDQLRALLAVSWNVPFDHFENTSLLAGLDNKRDFNVGIRVGF